VRIKPTTVIENALNYTQHMSNRARAHFIMKELSKNAYSVVPDQVIGVEPNNDWYRAAADLAARRHGVNVAVDDDEADK
jgi:hypothetical protein